MKKRKPISAAELYVILDREFRSQQPRECTRCYVTLPYRVDRSDPESPNWEIALPPPCEQRCAQVLEALVNQYAATYDLAPGNDAIDRSLH